jgi:mannose-6-phosphate isomerase
MASSDNVLRGGLTPKHVDVAELSRVVDFSTGPIEPMTPERPSSNQLVFRPDVPDFRLVQVTGPTTVVPSGASIVLCTSGEFEIVGAVSSARLSRGDAAFVTPVEAELRFEGSGELYLATAQ